MGRFGNMADDICGLASCCAERGDGFCCSCAFGTGRFPAVVFANVDCCAGAMMEAVVLIDEVEAERRCWDC
jgi:hypothetical protein